MSAKPLRHDTVADEINDLPAPPSLIQEVREIRASIGRLETALIGDEKMGHRGLVTRLTTAERALLALAFGLVILGGERIVKFFL